MLPLVVNQFYKAEILTEYVIRGNTAILKCSIPSFVADFVSVQAWLTDSGEALVPGGQPDGNARGLATACALVALAGLGDHRRVVAAPVWSGGVAQRSGPGQATAPRARSLGQ